MTNENIQNHIKFGYSHAIETAPHYSIVSFRRTWSRNYAFGSELNLSRILYWIQHGIPVLCQMDRSSIVSLVNQIAKSQVIAWSFYPIAHYLSDGLCGVRRPWSLTSKLHHQLQVSRDTILANLNFQGFSFFTMSCRQRQTCRRYNLEQLWATSGYEIWTLNSDARQKCRVNSLRVCKSFRQIPSILMFVSWKLDKQECVAVYRQIATSDGILTSSEVATRLELWG